MPTSLDLSIETEDEAIRLLAHHLRICRALFESTNRPSHVIATRLRIHLHGDAAATAGAIGFLTYIDNCYNSAEGGNDVT